MQIDERVARLIAVGASVSANCQPCLQRTVRQAREAGLREDEIADAITIGKTVRKGAASAMDALIAELGHDTGEVTSVCQCASPIAPREEMLR